MFGHSHMKVDCTGLGTIWESADPRAQGAATSENQGETASQPGRREGCKVIRPGAWGAGEVGLRSPASTEHGKGKLEGSALFLLCSFL